MAGGDESEMARARADVLDVRDLLVRRGDLFVLRVEALTLRPGDALMLVGANGAGKSTLLRVLASLLPRDAGTLRFAGLDPREDGGAYAARLHLVGHRDAVKGAFTVAETLRFWARVMGAAPDIAPALAASGLAALADLPAAYLSAGQRRRLALARLHLVRRPLWLLDEPASGLDAASRAALARQIDLHRAAGGLVVMASHGELALAGARELSLGDVP